MAVGQVRRDFDTLSAVYDETRPPLDAATIEGVGGYLRAHGWRNVLEVGVGTGRVAGPLVERGMRVVGIDASHGMLSRAAAKGLPYLVRGDAYHLPFPDRSFDCAFFVHVLHILEFPELALREAARVAEGGALAILDVPPRTGTGRDALEEEPRRIVREAFAEAGFPNLLRAGPRAKERRILEAYPPTELVVLSDREVTEPLSRRLDLIEKRAYRHVLTVPPEVLSRAVAAARARLGDRTVTYRRTESLARWATRPESLGGS